MSSPRAVQNVDQNLRAIIFSNAMALSPNILAPKFFFNFSTPCIQNVNNTGTKYVTIMKQTTF
jgi:hypothetical protein